MKLPRASILLLFAISGLVGPAEAWASTPSQPAPDLTQVSTQIRARLAEAQLELEGFLTGQAGATNLPSGATATDAIEYQLLLQATVRAYERQLDDLAALEALNQRRHEFIESAKTSPVLREPPPYSILLIDSLRDSVQALVAGVEAAQSARALFETLGAEAREGLKQSDARLRSLNERAEAPETPKRVASLTWQRSFEMARNQLAGANLAAFERRRQRAEVELLEQQQRLEFARRHLILAAQQVRFPRSDLDKVLANEDKNRAQLEADYRDAERGRQAAQQALGEAREKLHQCLSAASVGVSNSPAAAQLPALRQLVSLRVIQAETAAQKQSLTRQLLDSAVYERALWQARFSTFGSTDPMTLQQGYRRLASLQRFLATIKPHLLRQIELTGSQAEEVQQQPQNQPDAQPDPALAREGLVSYQEREALLRAALRKVQATERLLLRWKESLDQDRSAMPLMARARDLFTELSSLAGKLWNFELFVAEDTVTVDGQSITGRRSVTVNKITRAVLILVIGYWLVSWAASLLERLAVRRFEMEPNQASLVRRWTRVLLVLTLIILSLVWVKIPLTVFAFLGGALAIGLGFGTQSLLKNFVSGIIILFERPFRIGDVVAVADQRGTVTTIGIRSSILQLSDGTETLIPNSVLLETTLTNWTYTTRTVCSSISVLVAGGSDTRQVAQVLSKIATQHKFILTSPEPEVLFKGFEDSGFAFELSYWLDVRAHSPPRVASDLRHSIASAFADNGITLAFPQRDVHLDSPLPLQVQVVPTQDEHCVSGKGRS